MIMTMTQAAGRVPVTVLHIQGEVDGSSYAALIAKGGEVIQSGAHHIVLDLGGVQYLSSAGLLALHSIAQMARGLPPPDPEAGWEAFRSVTRDQSAGKQQHVKLLNPSPRVSKVLATAGFDRFFEIYTDQSVAVASF